MTARVRAVFHLSAGAALVLVTLAADRLLGHPARLGSLQVGVLALGVALVPLGFLDLGRISRLSANLCLVLLAALATLAIAEGACRAVGWDFAAAEVRAWKRVPPFYRQPTVPQGDAFFRRPGPERWTGQVLHTRLQQLGIHPDPYAAEPAITVAYDREGFRNPEGLTSWEIAVAGDSFTELGYLPQEQLFTSILGRKLQVSVKNLGASYTGPLTQLSYLREYGISPSTKDVIVVFFEGNDLKNLAAEHAALERWKRTGVRDRREIPSQPSLVRALAAAVSRLGARLSQPAVPLDYVTAAFRGKDGEVPVTLVYTPPARGELGEETLRQLDAFFQDYRALARSRSVRAWLAYMPAKERVLHGRLAFAPAAPPTLVTWRPTDLPDLVGEECRRHGVGFIDLTPALAEETAREGRLLYNAIYDSHLDARGSEVVAGELARHLAASRPESE